MTRAVLVKYTPGVYRCEACKEQIIGHKGRRPAICCHLYEAGKWTRDAYFHPDHYNGEYGPVIDRGTLPAKSRSGWTYA